LHKQFFVEITMPTFLLHSFMAIHRVIQKEMSIIWEVTLSNHCEKKVYINVYLILIGYRDSAVWTFRSNSLRFLFVSLDEVECFQKKDGHTRRNARSHFGCSCLHKENWKSAETNNTRSSHTICKVHWDFRTFIVTCNNSVIPVSQIFRLNMKLKVELN
jgi:hypothetical protein